MPGVMPDWKPPREKSMSSGSSKKPGSTSKVKGKGSAKKAASDAKELRKQLEKKAEKLAAKAADEAKKAQKKAKKKAAEQAEEARKAFKKAEKKAAKKAGKKSSGTGSKKSAEKNAKRGLSVRPGEVLLSPATETALVTPIDIGREVTPTSKSDLPSTVPVIVEAELSPATAPHVRAAAEAAMKPSEAWTVVALRARARQLGLVGYSSLSKSQLLERLRD